MNKQRKRITKKLPLPGRGAFGLVKGGLKFGGGISSIHSTSMKQVSSNQSLVPSKYLSPVLHCLKGSFNMG